MKRARKFFVGGTELPAARVFKRGQRIKDRGEYFSRLEAIAKRIMAQNPDIKKFELARAISASPDLPVKRSTGSVEKDLIVLQKSGRLGETVSKRHMTGYSPETHTALLEEVIKTGSCSAAAKKAGLNIVTPSNLVRRIKTFFLGAKGKESERIAAASSEFRIPVETIQRLVKSIVFARAKLLGKRRR